MRTTGGWLEMKWTAGVWIEGSFPHLKIEMWGTGGWLYVVHRAGAAVDSAQDDSVPMKLCFATLVH